ncbi:STE24 endopeptidase [Gammaproteobacteria bacterium]
MLHAMVFAHPFTLIFLTLLGLGTGFQYWLLWRQYHHVGACRDTVPGAFAEQVTPDEHRKAADYTRARLFPGAVGLAIEVVMVSLWTVGGGLEALDQLWLKGAFSPLVAGLGLLTSLAFVGGLVDLPLSLWRIFGIEARFGFNRTTLARFLIDLCLESVVFLILMLPLMAALLWLMARAGPLWWLAAWALWMAFMLLVSWLFPTLIAPLFNRFDPLPAGELRQRIEALLVRCGFSSRGIFVMDGSRRSGHGNAYFTGLGRAKRIVFFDTLMSALAPAELEAVLAHELGHFHHRHVQRRILGIALASLIGLAMLGWLAAQSWFFTALGVSRVSDALAVALFLLVVPVFTLWFQPLMAYWSRRQEFQADAFAVRHSDGPALIRALVRLYRDNANTLTPDPLYSACHDSHPPASIRISHLFASMGAS